MEVMKPGKSKLIIYVFICLVLNENNANRKTNDEKDIRRYFLHYYP